MPVKYLEYFPKPVLDDLIGGKWLPIVGAGMSLNAAVPPGRKMPLWSDLGDALTGELTDFPATSILDAISAYEHEYGRARLIERLSDILLIGDAQPGRAHLEFCTLPFDIVCTTNFDFLLERQYELTPKYVYPVVDEEQLSIGTGKAGTLLLKLHGDLNHPGRLIVSEADYDGFLTNYPLLATYLANQLITKTAVFIGYSLDDPDFRQIWHTITQRLGRTRRKAYAIAVNARSADVTRFERRGIKVVNLPGSRDKYGEILAATFKELREYMRDNVVKISRVKEELPLRELSLPRNAPTRLCFFSISVELLPFYRERIFPVVEEAGFVPVTADDVVTPGENVTAKIDSLIDRSAVMITELTTGWTIAEYRMALARIKANEQDPAQHKPLRLIVITTEPDQVPKLSRDITVLRRPNLPADRLDGFIEDLEGTLRRIADETETIRQAEPQRLLEAKEYRAAIISAMTLLESKLRESLNKVPWTQARRPFSLRSLIDLAAEHNILTSEERSQLEVWMRLRNEVVHTAHPVAKVQATEIVNAIMNLIVRM